MMGPRVNVTGNTRNDHLIPVPLWRRALKLPLNGTLPSFRNRQQTGRSKWGLTNPSLVPLSPPELPLNPQPRVRCAKLYPADRIGTVLRDEVRRLSGLPTFR